MITAKDLISKIEDGTITTPAGFQAMGIHTGVKKRRRDLGMIYCESPANAAAVYTTNIIQAAPIQVTKESLAQEGRLQAIVVNSGNANACTGDQGEADAFEMRRLTAQKFKIEEHLVAVASTGVIGEYLPMEKIRAGIEEILPERSMEGAKNFNEAILTTDTDSKSTCYQATIKGKKVTMAGSAKGSGMIAPNMATMLSFITTDLVISSENLKKALRQVTDQTFNCITVDGDTSTNDTVILLASGKAEHEPLTETDQDWSVFLELLRKTCEDLAKMIAKDGEGATKLIEVVVNGAKTDREALQVAKSVVGSSLVKTAVYGEDPNWGRIICAVGYSEATIDPNTIDLTIGSTQILKNSLPVSFVEEEVQQHLAKDEIKMIIDLHVGEGSGKAWGCDLTYDYIQINASYRT